MTLAGDVCTWPLTTQPNVRFNVGERAQSGLVVVFVKLRLPIKNVCG